MSGRWFKYLIYASLVFLAVALVRSDYLVVPHIESPLLLALSFPALFAGFLYMAIHWQVLLRLAGIETTLQRAIPSIGLSVFAKYIPGKVWVILGRAAYISEREGATKTATSTLSLQAQLISLWAGLLLGALGLAFTGNWSQLGSGPAIAALWLVLSGIIFTPYANRLATVAAKRLLNKELNLPVISLRKIAHAMPYFMLNWLFWCLGFYLLSQALTAQTVSPYSGLGFALGGTLGILAIVVPGGIGVREGFLAWYLIALGVDKPTAVTISVASRLWFLIGEAFIFAVGVVLDRRDARSRLPG